MQHIFRCILLQGPQVLVRNPISEQHHAGRKTKFHLTFFCNVSAPPPADPSYPGCVPERGSALADRRTDAIPADLASPA